MKRRKYDDMKIYSERQSEERGAKKEHMKRDRGREVERGRERERERERERKRDWLHHLL